MIKHINICTLNKFFAACYLSRNNVIINNVLTNQGTIKGESGGTTHWYSYGAGAISSVSKVPGYEQAIIGGIIQSSILIDLTNLGSSNDEGDAIGLTTGGGAAYIFKYVLAQMGIPFKIEVSCLELPLASSNELLDFDLLSCTAANKEYNDDIADGETDSVVLFASGGIFAKGKTIQNLVVNTPDADGDYVYLVTGATHGGTFVFTAGKLLITVYGHATF